MPMIEVEDEEEYEKAIEVEGDKLVVVEWGASWCKNCKRVEPAMHKLADKLGDHAQFVNVNIAEAEDLALDNGVSSVPRFFLMRGGKKIDEYTGSVESEIKAKILAQCPNFVPEDVRRACHWVTKVGNLKTTMAFYEGVLGLKVLRHEEFTEGCEATCNGPYAGAWSKTMVGYGPESDYFAIEVTYNYGIEEYAFGNDLQCLVLHGIPGAAAAAEALGYTTTQTEGGVMIAGPDNLNYLVMPEVPNRKDKFLAVRLRTNSVADAKAYWAELLGLTEVDAPAVVSVPSAAFAFTNGPDKEQSVALQFVQPSDGAPVDHALASGRVCFACDSVPPIYEMVKGAGDTIINEPLSLPTPGKADVVVTILSSRSDNYEICFVEHEAFYDLATPKYDVIDFAERATRGGDGAPPPKPALKHSDALETITTQEELDAAVAGAGDKLVVVDFGAGWCKKCSSLMPKMEGFADQFGAAATFLAVDVEEADDLALDLGVSALPRIFFYKDGAKVDDYLGSDAAEVKAKIEANVSAELAAAIASTPSGAGENYLAHWVFKIGNLKNTMRFYELVFGMRAMRHEEFKEGCEATCNGPYGGAWSKTMVAFGPENGNFAFELTYNYGIDGYTFGNDLQYIAMAVAGAEERAEAFGYTVVKEYHQGQLSTFVLSPDGYRFKVVAPIQGRGEQVLAVALRVADLSSAVDYYTNVLGFKVLPTLPGTEHPDSNVSVGWAEDQVRIQLIQVSDGQAVDHALSSGRHANVCKSVLPYYEGAKAAKDKIINKPLTLPTDGKADVVVSILADRDGYEICFVEDIGYWDLATPLYDLIDWAERASRGGDGAPPPKY